MKSTSTLSGPGRYADILLDDWFKRSFKEYGNAKRLMLLLLQELIPERKITSLTYTPEESTNQNPDRKSIRVDVECTDENGERFVVEVQRASQADFYDRAIFNSTFAIQRQVKENSLRYGFAPVYFIGIMRFSLHPESERYLYRYSLTEDQSGSLMTDDLHYVFLEVAKCRPAADAPLIEKVGYALNHMAEFTERPEGFEGEIFRLLFESAEISTFTPEEKIAYTEDMTTERDIRNQIAYARKEGRAEGRAEGKAEGANQEKLEIARKMVSMKLEASVISEATGLSEEEIATL